MWQWSQDMMTWNVSWLEQPINNSETSSKKPQGKGKASNILYYKLYSEITKSRLKYYTKLRVMLKYDTPDTVEKLSQGLAAYIMHLRLQLKVESLCWSTKQKYKHYENSTLSYPSTLWVPQPCYLGLHCYCQCNNTPAICIFIAVILRRCGWLTLTGNTENETPELTYVYLLKVIIQHLPFPYVTKFSSTVTLSNLDVLRKLNDMENEGIQHSSTFSI